MTRVEGSNGQVEFDGKVVSIQRDGKMAAMSHHPAKTIALADITRVDLEAKHLIVAGYIRFVTDESAEHESSIHAAYDEDAVLFKKHFEEFEALKAEIEAALAP